MSSQTKIIERHPGHDIVVVSSNPSTQSQTSRCVPVQRQNEVLMFIIVAGEAKAACPAGRTLQHSYRFQAIVLSAEHIHIFIKGSS